MVTSLKLPSFWNLRCPSVTMRSRSKSCGSTVIRCIPETWRKWKRASNINIIYYNITSWHTMTIFYFTSPRSSWVTCDDQLKKKGETRQVSAILCQDLGQDFQCWLPRASNLASKVREPTNIDNIDQANSFQLRLSVKTHGSSLKNLTEVWLNCASSSWFE